MKPTPLFNFLVRQVLFDRGWKRLPRKVRKAWQRDYWNSLRRTT